MNFSFRRSNLASAAALVLAISLACSRPVNAQDNRRSEKALRPDATWSQTTNGLAIGIRVLPSGAEVSPCIAIYFRGDPEAILARPLGTNAPPRPPGQEIEPSTLVYFMATNSLWGPMELRDAKGHKVAPVGPWVESTNAYPLYYSLAQVAMDVLAAHKFNAPHVPLPIRQNTAPVVTLFDFFNLKKEKPGEYYFTLWPKIYERLYRGSDLCWRVDLPPIRVRIYYELKDPKWEKLLGR